MAQLAALDQVDLGTTLHVRQNVIAQMQTGPTQYRCVIFGGTITFPRYAEQTIRFVFERMRFAVRDLPQDLDDAGKLTLVRRVVREGLLAADQI